MEKTIIIGGNFRGGTTLTTKLVQTAGIALPGEYRRNFENLALQKLLHMTDQVEEEDFRPLIDQYNAEHQVWGFKYPAVHAHLETIMPWFRNPKVVFVLRDPFAVADSERRSEGGLNDEHYIWRRTTEYNRRMVDLAIDYGEEQVLLISYEHLILRTKKEVNRLVDFLGQGDPQRLVEMIVSEPRARKPKSQ